VPIEEEEEAESRDIRKKRNIFILLHVRVKVKQSRYRPVEWPRDFQEVKVPRFHDNGTGWW
jgi:hypothetical protein